MTFPSSVFGAALNHCYAACKQAIVKLHFEISCLNHSCWLSHEEFGSRVKSPEIKKKMCAAPKEAAMMLSS